MKYSPAANMRDTGFRGKIKAGILRKASCIPYPGCGMIQSRTGADGSEEDKDDADACPGQCTYGGGNGMNSLEFAILAAAVFVVFIAVKFACQLRANRKRAERGETPKKYHDATDGPAPVNVIDWTRE